MLQRMSDVQSRNPRQKDKEAEEDKRIKLIQFTVEGRIEKL